MALCRFRLRAEVVYERERGFLVLLLADDEAAESCPLLLAILKVGEAVAPYIDRIEPPEDP